MAKWCNSGIPQFTDTLFKVCFLGFVFEPITEREDRCQSRNPCFPNRLREGCGNSDEHRKEFVKERIVFITEFLFDDLYYLHPMAGADEAQIGQF